MSMKIATIFNVIHRAWACVEKGDKAYHKPLRARKSLTYSVQLPDGGVCVELPVIMFVGYIESFGLNADDAADYVDMGVEIDETHREWAYKRRKFNEITELCLSTPKPEWDSGMAQWMRKIQQVNIRLEQSRPRQYIPDEAFIK